QDEYERLAKIAGIEAPMDPEEALTEWTSARTPSDVAETLQAAGIEAVPVQDFGDVFADPQLAHRGHFVPLVHPFLGEGAYERNGFRAATPAGYERPGPTLGQDNDLVLRDILGLTDGEIDALAAAGALD